MLTFSCIYRLTTKWRAEQLAANTSHSVGLYHTVGMLKSKLALSIYDDNNGGGDDDGGDDDDANVR